jgi:LCP family protein required for cell wall assembly
MSGRRRRRCTAAVVLTSLAAAILFAGTRGAQDMATAWLASMILGRVDVGPEDLDEESADGGSLWLVVGSDDRTDLPTSITAVGGADGARADVILLLAVNEDGHPPVRAVRLPRELMVSTPSHGRQRLGALLDHGPAALVTGVRAATGLPVHHYAELDMAAVVQVVDALDGLELDLPHPARDSRSGLQLGAGTQHLDGQAALAYLRSRTYEEQHGGRWEVTGRGEASRVDRQDRIITAVAELAEQAGPLDRLAAVRAVGDHLSVDRAAGPGDLDRLVSGVRQGPWTPVSLSVATMLPDTEVVSPFPPAHRGTFPAVDVRQHEADDQLEALLGRRTGPAGEDE